MKTRVLIALSCLLAAAHARPAAAPSSSCSVSCSGRNFWTGYKAGTTLQYAFEQKVEISSGLKQQKSLLMQVAGTANIEVHGDCEMILTVDVRSTKTSKSPNEATSLDTKALPIALVNALKVPLRFSFEDGRIQSLCPGDSENRASLNFKRGLLSQLHLSIDKPEQEVRVREVDVLGNCYTIYKNLGSKKFEKTKDLSSCNTNFEIYPRYGVKFEAPESSTQWPTVVQGNLRCTIEVDSESIKENQCEESRVLENNLGESNLGEQVKVTTSLKLQQRTPSVASSLFEVKERGNLNQKHKSGDKCHDSKAWFEEDIFHTGNECLEKKLPASGSASSDFKALAKRTIEELCDETKSRNMLNSSAAKYGDLIKYLRGITSQEDFTNLFDWVKAGYCSENTMLKVIVFSAIPSVGTRQSTQLILNQLKGSDGMTLDKFTATWLTNGIGSLPHPTPEIIRDVLEFTKKAKEESMLIISKDQPLALSAATGRYCSNVDSNCEINDAVIEVLKFFADALGTNCSKLESQEDQSAFDYAFAALLSIGNIGRAAGGAAAIIGCAENTKLSLANRVFSLRSLRRFPELSTSEKLRLGQLIKSKGLDSELRITAYQVIARFANPSFWSDERVIKKLSDLMQDETDDQQVQRYIYSHLTQWIKKQKRSTDSYTISNILREYEKVIAASKLSGMQVSSYWRKQFKSPSMKSKLEVESNLIYSSNSIMPRFANFNVTVETPLNGEAVNLFEVGLRMEGMEGIMEQLFNAINKEKSQDEELVRKRRQAPLELTEEQKQYKQEAKKMRLDLFVRKNGMEQFHNNFDDTVLGVVPQLMKTLDFSNVVGLAQEKLSNIAFTSADQSAGTLTDSTISVPTIAGFPILVKKEAYFLSNFGLEQSFDVSQSSVTMGFEIQPTATVHMARTVTVDSGFERAGLKSQTSALTSIAVKTSLEGKFNSLDDISFSFKMDPIKKQQTILELKTDIFFVQHNGASNVIATPVVSPSELAPVTSKCFTTASVKLFGRRLCLETNFEWTSRPQEYVRQNPGSFRLFIDKNESFGIYEATLKFKQTRDSVDFLAVLGDQKSTDRHAKILFSLVKSSDSRTITLELGNPVLPIKWVSESKKNGDGFDIGVELKFGSTDYAFKGSRIRESSGDWKLEGDFYRKDKERQRIKLATTYGFYGFFRYLPLFRFDVSATTPTNDKLTLNHLVKLDSGKLEIALQGNHQKSGSVVTSIKSRLQFIQRDAIGQTRALLYDTEVINKNGKNFMHTFSASVDRKRKDGVADTWTSNVNVIHKFQYGVSKENSVVDVDMGLQLEETIKPGRLYKSTGGGSVKIDGKTAKLTNLRFILGEDDVLDDHFNTKTFLLEYATDFEGSQAQSLIALQVLPIQNWNLYNQCIYVTLKANKKVGSERQEHAFELRHTSSRDKRIPLANMLNIQQTAKLVYANQVLLSATHKLFPISGPVGNGGREYVAGHTWSVKMYGGKTYASNTQYTISEVSQKTVFKIDTAFTADEERTLQLNQTLTVDIVGEKFDYIIISDGPYSFGSFRFYSKYYEYAERREAMKQIGDYLRNARTEGFRFTKFWGLVRKNVAKVESGFDLTMLPSYKLQVSNFFDMSVNNGVFVNFTRTLTTSGTVWKRAVVVYKELEIAPDRYRRFYRVNADINGAVSKYEFETLFLRSANPELKISVSKESTSSAQSSDFILNVGVHFVRRVSRDGQVALNLNVTHKCRTGIIEAKYKLVVDTAPWKLPNPVLNSSIAVTLTSKDPSAPLVSSFDAVYSLVSLKSQVSDRPTLRDMQAFNNELTIKNSFAAIPFATYKCVTTVTSSRDELFNFVFRKSLDNNDLINIKANLNSEQFYIGARSDALPVKEISYNVQYKRESDGFITYVSKLKLKTANNDIGLTDTGKLKAVGQSGTQLFSFTYSGNLKAEGLENIFPSIGRIDYRGLLVVHTTGEFDTNFQVTMVKNEISTNFGLVSLKLNYRPFEISSVLDTQLLNIGRYGLNISAGPSPPDSRFRLKAWVASPAKETTYQYWHTYNKKDKYEVNGQATFTSDHLFSQKSDKIDTTFNVNGVSFFDYSLQIKTTTPFNELQMIQYEAVSRELKQTVVFTIKSKGKQEDVLRVDHIQTKGNAVNTAKATIVFTPILQDLFGFRKISFVGDLVTGGDYAWGFELSKDDAKLGSFDILWLKSGGKYPHLSRLSTPAANLGFDLNGQSNFHFHVLRSGTTSKSLWELQYKGYTEVEAKVELTNGRVTSGTGKAGGKAIQFTSPSEGVIEIKAGSGTNKITYNSAPQTVSLKFAIEGKESCASYKKEPQQIIVKYGSCSLPNVLKINYQISDFWNMRRAKVDIKVEHTTVPASNQIFYLLPDLSVPLGPLSGSPFKYEIDMDNEKLKGKTSFESSVSGLKSSHEYDLSKFPVALKYRQNLNIDFGLWSTQQKWVIDFDTPAQTLDVRVEIDRSFKLAITTRQISIDVAGRFIGGVAYKNEASTQKEIIQIKWELNPAPGSQPCVLSLWRGKNGDGNIRVALEFVEHSGKELKVFTDVFKVDLTPAGYNLKFVTTLSSTLIEKLRSATSSVETSLKREAGAYTLTYKESFTTGGSLYYDIDVSLAGASMRFPSTVSSTLKGYVESEFKYNFNRQSDPEYYLIWSLSKYGELREAYRIEYRKKESSPVGQILGDFSLELSSPRRQFYLSENSKKLPDGTVQTELQGYLNKRNLEGFLAVFKINSTRPNVYKRSLQLTLPTRQVGYERELKIDGRKLSYNLVVFWDMQASLDKKISIQFEREKEPRLAGYYYYHRLELKAPFLKNKVTKEVLYERKENEFTLSWIHSQESYDKVTMKITGKQYWNQGRGGFQKELNFSFAQQRGDVKADTRITLETARLLNQKLPQVYTSAKFIHVINIYTLIPSQSVDSHVRFRIVPSEEFTYACNHGATFSFRYYEGFKRSRLFVFVSNSKKEAGQLTVVRDWLMSTWQATLDSGTGYMDPKSALSFPIYEPTKVLVKVTAGLSSNRKKIHFGVVNGAMSVSTNVNLWKPDTVPADLDFLFVGAKLNADNTLGYASHWRIRQATVKSPFLYVKEILVDPWTKVKNLPLGTSTVNKVLKPVFQSKSDNIDTDVVLDILTSISSNDIDSLKRWTEKARENNEFLSNTIGNNIYYGFNLVRGGVQDWAAAVKALPYVDVLPSDLGILAGIGKLSDAAERVMSSIPVGYIWGQTLSWIKYASDLFSRYFSSYVDKLGSDIRDRITSLTGGAGASILDMVYKAITDVYPLKQAFEKLVTVISIATESIWTADVELTTQFGSALQPFLISILPDLTRVYEFHENLFYEITQWGTYINGLIQAIIRDSSQTLDKTKEDLAEGRIPGLSAFNKNLMTSLGLFIVGDYSGAIRQYFNTEANVVRVWRVNCDQACLNSGSFAAINGSIYLPFDASIAQKIQPDDQLINPPSYAMNYQMRLDRRSRLSLDTLRSDKGFGGIVRKLISPEHRTAEAAGTLIRTFDGKELTNLSPCRYLLAHDFQNEDFSIYQTYTWDGRQRARGDLLVRFFKVKATISNRNELTLDDKPTTLPASQMFGEQYVTASKSGDAITVTFGGELQNAVVVKCRTYRDSCTVRVHPLYYGRLNGAFGSNDGNPENDLHAKSNSEHMRIWVTDSCVQS